MKELNTICIYKLNLLTQHYPTLQPLAARLISCIWEISSSVLRLKHLQRLLTLNYECGLIIIPLTLLGWNPQRYTPTPLWRTAELPGKRIHTYTHTSTYTLWWTAKDNEIETKTRGGQRPNKLPGSVRVNERKQDVSGDNNFILKE